MKSGPEYNITEMPIIHYLSHLGYSYLRPEENDFARDGQNQVILRDVFLSAVKRINGLTDEDAQSVYREILNIEDNGKWTSVLRGNYSKTIPGKAKKQTIHLIDFPNTENNTFTITNQFYVEAEKSRKPDIVIFINGIPVVVIEAKSPFAFRQKMGEAFDQIKQYEEQIPRLFYSNAFSIITDGVNLLYGATGSPSDFWGEWKDAFPKNDKDFNDKFEKGLFSLLDPSRLPDIIAHFIVFERDEESGRMIKKICRYQQFRAVNKIVERVMENGKKGERKGLIWHTQGSGKSLTMVYAVVKLKQHLTIGSETLSSPNILVITDRVDLDRQISNTFKACGLPNPKQIYSKEDLKSEIYWNTTGLTLLSTIYKFAGLTDPVENSEKWIILTDESHRTQESDLGAFLRTCFPDACYFGFTGTPVQNDSHDTYANFSPKGELYLDKYGIDDAVADGATVPIHYTARKAEWHLEAEKLDILFDNWFATETKERREEIKKRGMTIEALAKHPKRIELIAYDMWTHFKEYALKDGFKAQIAAIDREAVILYKRALDKIISGDLNITEKEASEYAVCVYSPSQEDAKPSEDPYMQTIRNDFLKYQLSDDKGGKWSGIKSGKGTQTEKEVIKAFRIKHKPPYFLIVCAKLLTGFDCPVESVMYLDNPLKEHTLLQAIARTNRVEGPYKQNGLIVDYIGITKYLNQALSTYRKEDVENALHNLDELRSYLEASHREVMRYITIKRDKNGNLHNEYNTLIQALGTLDTWFNFKQKANAFIKAYEALSPDSAILYYRDDMKWIAGFIEYATMHFEKKESFSLRNYSAKIREMLGKHLSVTGITTLIQLRNLTDPAFFSDFEKEKKNDDDLQTVAVRKAAELKKIISEKMAENPLQYEPFSKRVMDLIKRFEQGLLSIVEMLRQEEELAKGLVAEENAYKKSGLNKRAHGVYKILRAFMNEPEGGGPEAGQKAETEVRERTEEYLPKLNKLQEIAVEIDDLYSSNDTAPVGWHLKEMLKKELRQSIRRIILPAGFTDWKNIPAEIENYALKHYVKVS